MARRAGRLWWAWAHRRLRKNHQPEAVASLGGGSDPGNEKMAPRQRWRTIWKEGKTTAQGRVRTLSPWCTRCCTDRGWRSARLLLWKQHRQPERWAAHLWGRLGLRLQGVAWPTHPRVLSLPATQGGIHPLPALPHFW